MNLRTIFPRRVAARIWLHKHGAAWPLAVTLTVGCLCALLWKQEHQSARVAQLRSGIAAARAELDANRKAAAATPVSDARELEAVLRTSLPADEAVRKMLALAGAEQIALPQAEYQERAVANTALRQLRITQPVKATYPQLRRYAEAVLRALPNASLDQVSAHRETVGQAQLDARLRWSLWAAPASSSAPVEPASTAPEPASPGKDDDAPVLLARRDALIAGSDKPVARDLFEARSWAPPAPAPAPAQESAPVAPPLPFTFMGKKLEGSAWEVYLSRADQSLIVRAGSVVDGIYRVDRIEPPMLTLTYLPLGQAQTLAIGDAL